MDSSGSIEIRLLGPLQVRRPDSTLVPAGEWRTSKTVDLLRLLAVQVDEPVRIERLLDLLWPGVEESKARASLRTAASQIRRAVGIDCIERHLDRLTLRHAWVDTRAFEALALEARAARRAGDDALAVESAIEAEALYLHDFTAHDDDSDWAREIRETLVNLRMTMLADAAEAAVSLRWMRDAIDLATRTIELDPCCERAHRSLMQAYQGLGEAEQGLRVYDRLRRMLAEEVGADPSPTTTAVFQQMLAGHREANREPVFVGRERELLDLARVLRRADPGVTTVVMVRGHEGSGRHALLVESARRAGLEVVEVAQGSVVEPQAPLRATEPPARLVLLPGVDGDLDEAHRSSLLAGLSRLTAAHPGVVVGVPVTFEAYAGLGAVLAASGLTTLHTVDSHALTPKDLECLAEQVLSGQPTSQLLTSLMEESQGLAGLAVDTIARWLAKGQIVCTGTGLEVAPAVLAADNGPEMGIGVRRALAQLSPLETEVAQLLALLDGGGGPHVLASLLQRRSWPDVRVDDVIAATDRLLDLRLLRVHDRGLKFRHPGVQASVLAWLRPSHLRELHRLVAEFGGGSATSRAHHWREAGESQRACECYLEAAMQASREDIGAALSHLEETFALAQSLESAEARQATHRRIEVLARRWGHTALAETASRQAGRSVPEETSVPGPAPATAPRPVRVPVQTGWGEALEQQIQRALASATPGPGLEVSLSVAFTSAAPPYATDVPALRQPRYPLYGLGDSADAHGP